MGLSGDASGRRVCGLGMDSQASLGGVGNSGV